MKDHPAITRRIDLGENPRQTGTVSLRQVLIRRIWDLFRANLILLAGLLPGGLLIIWGIWGGSLPVSLVGGVMGGLVGGPLLCGLYDTILRALHEESGFWSLYYRHTLTRVWKRALFPGAVTGSIMALWLFEAFLLGAQGPVPPMVFFALAEVLFFLLGMSNYIFPQIVMVSVSTRSLYTNSVRLLLGLLPRSAASAAIQTVYWGGFLLLLPRSVPLLVVTGFWLPCLLSLKILVEPMERCLYAHNNQKG